MKRTILLLLFAALFSSAVNAIEIGRYKNKNGGNIVLRSEICADGVNRLVYAFSSTGKAINGCWLKAGNDIVVHWADGDSYVYPVLELNFSPEFIQETSRQNSKGNT